MERPPQGKEAKDMRRIVPYAVLRLLGGRLFFLIFGNHLEQVRVYTFS